MQQKPKPLESLNEDHVGESHFAFPNEKWLSYGYRLFLNDSGNCSRDFWIGQPLISESEIGCFNQYPAFWSCANKMMTCLLFLSDRKDDHGARPHSLKVSTISAIMEEIAKGNANLPHLAMQGNYRAATAHDMGKAYSRNSAQRQNFVSKLAQKAPRENPTAESLTTGPPELPGGNQGGDKSLNAEILGGNRPTGRSQS